MAIKEITDQLGDKYDFEMLTAHLGAKLPSKEKVGNVMVHRFCGKLTLALFGVFKIFVLGKFDLFWCVQVSYASGPAYAYNILKFWKKVPIILTLQEGDSEEHLTKRHFGLIDLSWRLAMTRSAYVTAISKYLATRAEKYGAKREKLIVVPNGVASLFFNTKKKEHENTVLIHTGRLVRKNAVEVIVQALNFLPGNVKLVSVGDGPVKISGPRVIQKSFMSQERLAEELAQADIFVRPSRSEGLGNSFLEAMAVGLPIIGTNVGGIPDFLTDRETGLFCKVDDPEDLAEKVKLIASDKYLREKIVASAENLMKEKYTWEKISQQMYEVFTKA